MKTKSLLFALSLLLCAAVAHADSTGRANYEAGTRLFNAGKYRQALVEFTAGYEVSQRPGFLLNIAQCHRQLGELDRAQGRFREFLERAPDAPEAESVRSLLHLLDQEVAAQEKEKAKNTRPAVAVEVVTAPPPPPAKKPVYKRWWFWTAIGGAVVAGTAVGLGVGLSHRGNGFSSDLPVWELNRTTQPSFSH